MTVSIDVKGDIYLQETLVEPAELVARLLAIAENQTSRRIFVRGDRAVDYGAVMVVMGSLNAAGFNKVALVTQVPRADKTGRKATKNAPGAKK